MNDEGALTLESYLQVLPALDEQQLLAISAAHRAIDGASLEAARASAAEIARSGKVLDELQALQSTIAQWIGSRYAASRRYTGEGLTDPPMLIVVREQARPALPDAATALFLVEQLPQEAFETLVGPVDSVVG